MKPGLVAPEESPTNIPSAPVSVRPVEIASSLAAEAKDLLAKVQEGGVPAYMTDNLARIARENGVEVQPEMTPNQVIDALRERESA